MEDVKMQQEVLRSTIVEEDEMKIILKSISEIEGIDDFFRTFAHKDMILEFNTQEDKERNMAKGAYYRMVHIMKKLREVRDPLTSSE